MHMYHCSAMRCMASCPVALTLKSLPLCCSAPSASPHAKDRHKKCHKHPSQDQLGSSNLYLGIEGPTLQLQAVTSSLPTYSARHLPIACLLA